jgi:hypothetical protein
MPERRPASGHYTIRLPAGQIIDSEDDPSEHGTCIFQMPVGLNSRFHHTQQPPDPNLPVQWASRNQLDKRAKV